MPGAKKKRKIELTDRDYALLLGLFESRVAKLSHIAILYFNNNPETAKKRVQRLKEGLYIGERARRPYEPSILFLKKKGFEALNEAEKLDPSWPRFSWDMLKKRIAVPESRLNHELSVMDVKRAFVSAIGKRLGLDLIEFQTWPRLCQFEARRPVIRGGRSVTTIGVVKPDGFFRTIDANFEQFFFLEVDKGTEAQKILGRKAEGYQDFYKKGGLARRFNHPLEDAKLFGFRVLMVLDNDERRNNTAERLCLQRVSTMVLLTTREEVESDPLGAIWIRPKEYREATKGTVYQPKQRGPSDVYRRQVAREKFIAEAVEKLALFPAIGRQ